MEAPAPLSGPQNTPRGGRETLENQHPQPMVVDVDLGAPRRPHPVHKSAPKGNPKTLKNQHEFSQVVSYRFRIVFCPFGLAFELCSKSFRSVRGRFQPSGW